AKALGAKAPTQTRNEAQTAASIARRRPGREGGFVDIGVFSLLILASGMSVVPLRPGGVAPSLVGASRAVLAPMSRLVLLRLLLLVLHRLLGLDGGRLVAGPTRRRAGRRRGRRRRGRLTAAAFAGAGRRRSFVLRLDPTFGADVVQIALLIG